MKKYWLRYTILILGIIIAGVTFHSEIYDIIKGLGKISIFTVLLMILCMTIYYVLDGVIITKVFKHKHNRIRYRDGIACTYYCAFFRVVSLGSGSGIAEVVYMSKCGVDAAVASSISMIQYILQKVTIVLLGIVSYIVFFKDVDKLLGKYSEFMLVGVLLAFVIISLILIVCSSKKFSNCIIWLLRKIGNKRFGKKIDKLENTFSELQITSEDMFKRKKLMLEVILINIAKLTVMFCTPYILINSGISLPYSIGIFAVSHMLAGVIPAPSGYGSLDVLFMLLYGSIVGGSMTALLIVLFRGANTIFSFIVGACIYAIRFRD